MRPSVVRVTLVIAALIIGAIFAIKGTVQNNMNTLFTKAVDQTKTAGDSVGTVAPE